jgi:hypothetical protein
MSQWPLDSGWDGAVTDAAGLPAFLADLAVPFELFSPDGRCVYCNDECRELFGSAPPPDYNALEDEIAEREGVLDLIRRGFAGEVVRIPPFWYDPRDHKRLVVDQGRRVAIETMVVPLRDGGGKVSQVAVIFKDRSPHEAPTIPAPPIVTAADLAFGTLTAFTARDVAEALEGLIASLAAARSELAAEAQDAGSSGASRIGRARQRLDEATAAADEIRSRIEDLALLGPVEGDAGPERAHAAAGDVE